MAGKLQGKVALVTGASKGIGASISTHLAAEGAAIVVNYSSSKEGADRVVAEIAGKGGKAVAVQADVSKKADVDRLFAEAKRAFGRLDILVNNAGIYAFAPLEAITEEQFHAQFNLNVLGLILASQKAAEAFGPEGGSIINISSVVAFAPPPNGSVYSATKGAVDAVTRSLSKELGPRKIRVNSLNPGLIATEGTCTPPASSTATSRSRCSRMAPSGASGSRMTSPRSPPSSPPRIPGGSPARSSPSRADGPELPGVAGPWRAIAARPGDSWQAVPGSVRISGVDGRLDGRSESLHPP